MSLWSRFSTCAALLVVLAACKAPSSDPDPAADAVPSGGAPTVSVTDEPAGANCPAGGKKITVQNAGSTPTISYVCNGLNGQAGQNGQDGQSGQSGQNGQNGAAGSVAWEALAVDTAAVPGHGYLTVAPGQVTLTLPATAALTAGEGFDVLGVGTGGFAVAAGPDQRIVFADGVAPFPGLAWAAHPPQRAWGAVASSADGTTLVAAGFDGLLYVSTDAGTTWTPRGLTANWSSVAASADGVRLVAVSSSGPNNSLGQLHVSTDSGLTWTQRGPVGEWTSVASSADGLRIVAAMNNGVLWTSTDAVGFVGREASRPWKAVASSADGLRLVAVAGPTQTVPGRVYLSVDAGITWTPRGPSGSWAAVASSADGTRLAAAANAAVGSGQLFVSDDAGLSWAPRGDATRTWAALALSADAGRLAGVACQGAAACRVLLSDDLGATWLPRASASLDWTDVALSRDGTRIVAGARNDALYTSAAPASTTALLEGAQGARLQLRHAGHGTWVVSDVLGTIRAY